jgi:hypothetical protein
MLCTTLEQKVYHDIAEIPEKTTDLSQVTDKLSHNVVSSTPRHERGSNLQL